MCLDYPTRVPGSCGSVTKFDCGNGKCIDFSLVRNCVDNCGNGADECIEKLFTFNVEEV